MNPPTEKDLESFNALNGGNISCIKILAEQLIHHGSISETTSKIKEAIDAWPDNHMYLEHLEIFSFMMKRIDQHLIHNLLEGQREKHTEYSNTQDEIKINEDKLMTLNKEWNETVSKLNDKFISFYRLVNEWKIKDVPFPSTNIILIPFFIKEHSRYIISRKSIIEELNKFVDEINNQILREKFEIKIIYKIDSLFEIISTLDNLHKEISDKEEKKDSLTKKGNTELKFLEQLREKLVFELNKIQLSGRMSLYFIVKNTY